jgi:hypothetical protein
MAGVEYRFMELLGGGLVELEVEHEIKASDSDVLRLEDAISADQKPNEPATLLKPVKLVIRMPKANGKCISRCTAIVCTLEWHCTCCQVCLLSDDGDLFIT